MKACTCITFIIFRPCPGSVRGISGPRLLISINMLTLGKPLCGSFRPILAASGLAVEISCYTCYDTIIRFLQFHAWFSCTVFMHDEQVVSKKDVNIMIVVRIAYLKKHNTDVPMSLRYAEVR